MVNAKKTLKENRTWLLKVIAAVAVIAVIGISGVLVSMSPFFHTYDDELGATAELENVQVEIEEESKLSNITSEETIRKGESLYSILTAEGLSPREVHEITTQLKGNFSVRNFRPGKSYLIEKDPSGCFLCFSYQQSPSNILHVQRDPEAETFNIWQETFEYQSRVSALTGTISSNLAAELQQHKRYGLITQLQKLFAYKINFKRDIQPGTAYNILFEEKWLGDEFVGIGKILAAEIFIDNQPSTAYRFTDSKGNTGYYDKKGQSVISSFFINPCNYSRVSSRFGYRTHPILRKRHFHGGVDFAAPRGTPVYAVADGKIVFRGRKGAAGNMVTITHANGYHTKYLHLSRFSANARSGSRVKQGQVIGYVGSTGRSTGPHLDFRVVHHGKLQNPLVALKSACKIKGLPKAEMDNFLAQISVFHMQLENRDILVAELSKPPTDNASALN
ncbi:MULTISPECIES: M23 family metallopeptidase [Prosthecochloris]|uniref:Peptidase M24 n=1 Tax=Prosthecochloris marina TaxID=2017681 RepID=A0A317T8R8_9CHLB|nr:MULTISPECIES: M23 family metallopeptidase [Prosthecochloris]PWW82740.1 peptidase M24 [Prosthecochloris marina]UZJ37971.1 M23 family metallopeptidase [Prosthecochloris sp. SCSIO W1103]